MIHKTFRPATSWEEVRAGTDQLVWQQISVHNTKASVSQQQNSIISYSVDDGLNVIRVQFGPHLSEVWP